MYVLHLLLLLAAIHLGVSQASYKRWVQSTNFENPSNWNAGRAPCGNDVVTIPDGTPVIYMQVNTTLQAINLPQNSEIVFGDGLTVGFTNTADSACSTFQGDVDYNLHNARRWLDPTNWCQSETDVGPCQQPPRLDSEKVPCSTDNVLFPEKNLFYVDLGQNLNININRLKYDSIVFSTSTFNQFRTSLDGARVFPPPSSGSASTVTIARRPVACVDLTGCACGNDQGQVFTKLCSTITNRCERAMCRSPIKPAGSCCFMCGTMFTATITGGSGFRFTDYKNIFQGFVTNQGRNSNTTLIASKMSGGTIQTVLSGGDGQSSNTLAANIVADIQADTLSGGHKYRIASYYVNSSGDGIPTTTASTTTTAVPSTTTAQQGSSGKSSPGASGSSSPLTGSTAPGSFSTGTPLGQTGSPMSGGSVAGLVIGLLLLILVGAFVGFFLYRRRIGQPIGAVDYLTAINPRSLIPKRWSTRGSRQQPMHVEMQTPEGGFPNPLYGTSSGNGNNDMPPMVLMPLEEQPTFVVNDAGFENPLYSTVGKVEPYYQDPTKMNIPDDNM